MSREIEIPFVIALQKKKRKKKAKYKLKNLVQPLKFRCSSIKAILIQTSPDSLFTRTKRLKNFDVIIIAQIDAIFGTTGSVLIYK